MSLAWSGRDESQASACYTWQCDQPCAPDEAFEIRGTWLEVVDLVPDMSDPLGSLAHTCNDESTIQTSHEHPVMTDDQAFFGAEGFQTQYVDPRLGQFQRQRSFRSCGKVYNHRQPSGQQLTQQASRPSRTVASDISRQAGAVL